MAEYDADALHADLIELTSEVVAAYVAHNSISSADLPKLIADVYAAMASLGAGSAKTIEPDVPALVPAVSIRKSVTPDYLVCLDDGLKFKALKRHLATLGMTPDQYRAKWGLPKDYPMVAPNYAATRSQLAKQNGLGRKPSAPPPLARTTRKRVKA
jgi:predicted transcriptional regulator